MRVNIYAEEMTDRIEIISKEIDGNSFTALRFYLALPVTLPATVIGFGENHGLDVETSEDGKLLVAGPFVHRPGDDDSAAVTFWGKQDLRIVLRKALAQLDAHYAARDTKEPT